MTPPPRDHQVPMDDRPTIRQPERFSEYFDFTNYPDKANKRVTRNELAFILLHEHRVQDAKAALARQNHPARAFWRWLTGRDIKPPTTEKPTENTP